MSECEYIAAGGNRHPAASDWQGDTLAFGSDRNIALWKPQTSSRGIIELLYGHTDTVNAVRFLHTIKHGPLLLSGSVDKTIRVWKLCTDVDAADRYRCVSVLTDHVGSINCIAVADCSTLFATGAADATLKIWRISDEVQQEIVHLVQSIVIKPRLLPLALALSRLCGDDDRHVLAVAGTSTVIQLYVDGAESASGFQLQATLSGHEGWIRSLAFTPESLDEASDLLLSSASQDKYIRLWRIHRGKDMHGTLATGNDPFLSAFMPGKSLSNKAHRLSVSGLDYTTTFEALLLGHDDWIYSTRWHRTTAGALQLLSASADTSLSIWQADAVSSIWLSTARLGEISSQKGSTTATGSTGGFWTGLFSPDGSTLVCLGRTGAWRLWNFSSEEDSWLPGTGIGGHTKVITGLAWSKSGDYLLTTSSDQTTRLHAQWTHVDNPSWHEMARPQIHGYDLNCIDTLGSTSFVSGADEKLLRVFSEPKAVADLLETLSDIKVDPTITMPDGANIPVLGLSNKAIDAVADDVPSSTSAPSWNNQDRDATDPASIIHTSTLKVSRPPLEESLSRHTLWPEIEKLYGHGYEISCLAASYDGVLVATACKASSIDHAVIRIFETSKWTEVRPPLQYHSLTITRLRFQKSGALLLSVGRDRQWAVWGPKDEDSPHGAYKLLISNEKAHSRMILDCAWAPSGRNVFATAGRDKTVLIWKIADDYTSAEVMYSIQADAPVRAIDFAEVSVNGCSRLAIGTELGTLTVHDIQLDYVAERIPEVTLYRWYSAPVTAVRESVQKTPLSSPCKAITQLAWRPPRAGTIDADKVSLAVASEDSSLRIYTMQRSSKD